MGQRLTTMTSDQKRFPIAPTKFTFEKMATSDGAWMSELLPLHAEDGRGPVHHQVDAHRGDQP